MSLEASIYLYYRLSVSKIGLAVPVRQIFQDGESATGCTQL
jgi:hypothetical protein